VRKDVFDEKLGEPHTCGAHRKLILTRRQFSTVRARALEPEFEEFLKGNEPTSLEERLPTQEDLEDLELLKKFKLVSTDSTLD